MPKMITRTITEKRRIIGLSEAGEQRHGCTFYPVRIPDGVKDKVALAMYCADKPSLQPDDVVIWTEETTAKFAMTVEEFMAYAENVTVKEKS